MFGRFSLRSPLVVVAALFGLMALPLPGCAATRVKFEETPQASPPGPATSGPVINVGSGMTPTVATAKAFEYFSQKDVQIKDFQFIERRKPDGTYERIVKLGSGAGDASDVNAITAGAVRDAFMLGAQVAKSALGVPSLPAIPPATPPPAAAKPKTEEGDTPQ